MIYLYFGKIGDGKTYHVVKNELVPAVKAGRRVYTNIDGFGEGKYLRRLSEKTGRAPHEILVTKIASTDEWRDLLRLDLNDKEGTSLKVQRDSVIVADEAQLIWDARDFKNTNKEFLWLLEYHRHFGLDFIFITQDVKRLEKAIRSVTNECYQVKNLKFLSALVGNKYVKHVRQTPDSPITTTEHGTLDPEYFQLYRSAVQHSRFARAGGAYLSTPIAFLVLTFIALAGYTVWKKNPFIGRKPANAQVSTDSSVVLSRPLPVAVDYKDALNNGSLTEGTTAYELIAARASLESPPALGCTLKKVPWSYRIVWKGVTETMQGVREEAVCF